MATTTYNAQLPDYAKPYVEDMLSKTQAYTDINANPYQQYKGDRVADFSALQKKAFAGAANMQPSKYIGQGAGIANLASNQALAAGKNFKALDAKNQYTAPDAYNASETGNFYTSQGPYTARNVEGQQFDQAAAQQYMNPYLQFALDPQLDEARRQAQISRMGDAARLSKAGAFGGSRQAIMESEMNRNLMDKQNAMLAQGYNTAFTNAQQQFNADQARRMQAEQLNEQSSQFGANLGLQNAQTEAQYGLAGAGLSQADRQFAQQQAMMNAQNQASFGQQAAQLGEQSRQYGAGLGLQGASVALQGANTLGTLGAQQFNQQKDISNLQYLYGTEQQKRDQALKDVDYQNFQAAQAYPKDMLTFQSNMLKGLPLNSQTTTTPDPSALTQLVGLAGAASSILAKGGRVRDGGDPGIMALMASKYA